MGSEAFWENLWGRIWNPVTWFEVLLLFLTIPIWMPIVRALWREVQEVLAPYGGVYGRHRPRPTAPRAPGEDPFAKIPIQRRRRTSLSAAPRRERVASEGATATSGARSATHTARRPQRRPSFRSTM